MQWRRLGLMTLLFFGVSDRGLAIRMSVSPTVGLMQQPTSQYYHFVQGAWFSLSSEENKFVSRLSYLERPEFEKHNFKDQEQFGFIEFGTNVPTFPELQLTVGYGQVLGTIEYIGDQDMLELIERKRSYQQPGLIVSFYILKTWQFFEFSLNHSLFIGYSGDDDLEVYVAWPFSFFNASVGVFL